MTRGRAAALAAIGFALGAAAAGLNLWRGGGEPPPLSPAAAIAPERDAPRCTDPPEVATRAAIVERLAKEAETLFAANMQAHFQPPKDLPARFSGPAIERALQTAVDAAGVKADLLGTDCSEYPCITTARVHSAEEMQRIKDQFFDQPAYATDMKQLYRARGEGPTEYRFGAAIYPATDPRLGEILAALGRRLGVARMGPGSPHPERHPFPPDTIGTNADPALKDPTERVGAAPVTGAR